MGAKKKLEYLKDWCNRKISHYENKEYKDTAFSKGFKDGVLLALGQLDTVINSGYELESRDTSEKRTEME